jgi:hypothetical protein
MIIHICSMMQEVADHFEVSTLTGQLKRSPSILHPPPPPPPLFNNKNSTTVRHITFQHINTTSITTNIQQTERPFKHTVANTNTI